MSAVIVFGATGGIGRALARRLDAAGANLVVAARSADALTALAADLSRAPVQAPVDVRDPDAVLAVVDRAVEAHGRLDGVANCVGSLLLKPAHITTPAEFADVMATNLTSAFNVVRAATRVMTRTGGGSIVLVSSAAATAGLANHEAIAAAKAGIEGLARSAAASYAAKGVRVNTVAPGMTRTPLTAPMLANDAAEAASTALHALGRLGDPDEVAAAIEYLLGADAAWVTGQVMGVDGGLATVRSRRG